MLLKKVDNNAISNFIIFNDITNAAQFARSYIYIYTHRMWIQNSVQESFILNILSKSFYIDT